MGIASLVLGIVSIVVGFIPFCGWVAMVPAIVGLVLGIVELSRISNTNNPKGMAVAGIILNAVAVALIVFWTVVVAGISSLPSFFE